MSSAVPSRRRGRRPGPTTTPAEVLAAARSVFADAGFDRATVRAIAAAAQVDPSLVIQQFGSKEALFGAVVADLRHRVSENLPLFTESPGSLGERLARFYFTTWEAQASRETFLAVIRSVNTQGRTAAVAALVETFLSLIVPAVLAETGDIDAEAALAPIAAQLVGTAVTRYLIEAPFVADAPTDRLVEMTAPVLDGILARAGYHPQ